MDARSVRALHRGGAGESLDAIDHVVSARRPRRLVARRGQGRELRRARSVGGVVEASGSAAAQERVVHDGRAVARIPSRAPRQAPHRRRDVPRVEQRRRSRSVLIAAVAAVGWLPASAGRVSLPVGSTLHRYAAVEAHMGTLVQVIVYTPDEQQATGAFRAAFDRIAALDRILSDYRADSE